MRRILAFSALLFAICNTAHAADTKTVRLSLVQPSSGSYNWGTKINTDLLILDSSAAIQNLPNTFQNASTNTFLGATLILKSTFTLYGSSMGINIPQGVNPVALEQISSGTLQIDGAGAGFKYVDGNQASGKVLQSDANGLASWQTAASGSASTLVTAMYGQVAFTPFASYWVAQTSTTVSANCRYFTVSVTFSFADGNILAYYPYDFAILFGGSCSNRTGGVNAKLGCYKYHRVSKTAADGVDEGYTYTDGYDFGSYATNRVIATSIVSENNSAGNVYFENGGPVITCW